MSLHLLHDHRDVIIANTQNQAAISSTLKTKQGYTHIRCRGDDETTGFFVSFGYNSGWTKKPYMRKALDNIREHKAKHLEVCESLLDEIAAHKDAAPTPTPVADGKLQEKYNRLEKKYEAAQRQADVFAAASTRYELQLKMMRRLYGLNEEEIAAIAHKIRQIESNNAELHPDDECEQGQATERDCEAITLEEIRESM